MDKNTKKIWMKLFTIGMYLFLTLAFIVLIGQKKNLHTDEILTFILSNNTANESIQLSPELGVIYTPADQMWQDQMAVQKGASFHYANVWKMQTADVHPPLYYVLVHTICSFMPGIVSKWQTAAVNLLFVFLTFYAMRKLLKILTGDNEVAVFLASAFYCVSSGVLSSFTFLRMYVMLQFWVTWMTVLMLRALEKENRNRRFYVGIMLTALAGALTHYYFVVYLFFLCIAYGILLFIQKDYKAIGVSILSMIAAGVLTIVIFPASIKHSIGGGYRGIDTLNNLKDFSGAGMLYRLKVCLTLLDQQIFGKCLWGMLALIGGLSVWVWISDKKKKEAGYGTNTNGGKWCWQKWFLVAVPTICYFLLVSKMAVYLIDRYFHPIYAVSIALVVGTLGNLISRVKHQKVGVVLLAIFLLGATLFPFKQNFNYLYRHSGQFLEQTKQYENVNALMVVEYAYEMGTAYYEAKNYQSMTFLTTRDFDRLDDLSLEVDNGIILILGNACEKESVFEAIQKRWPNLSQMEEIGGYSSTTSFYCHE